MKLKVLHSDSNCSRARSAHAGMMPFSLMIIQEFQKICGYDLHFKCLRVAEEVFEDKCNSFLVFGDILKEIMVRNIP